MLQQMMQGQNPFAGGGNPFGGMPGMGGFPGMGPGGQHEKSGGTSRRMPLQRPDEKTRSGKNKNAHEPKDRLGIKPAHSKQRPLSAELLSVI